MPKFHDLDFKKLPDGGIHFEQSNGVNEPNVIQLHPEQVLFVARQYCELKSEPTGQIQELARRVAVLTDKIQAMVCNKAFRTDLIECCGDGFEYLARFDALLDLALEYDGGRLMPEEALEEAQESPLVIAMQRRQRRCNAPETVTESSAEQIHISGL